MNNAKNITWENGEPYCRWKGMKHDEYKKLLGVDIELEVDIPGLVKLGDVVYCESPQVFLEFLHTVHEDDLYNVVHEIQQVRTFEQMRFDVDMELLREFTSDLKAHYETLQ